MSVLDLGCGKSKEPGAFGVDVHPFPGVDLVHDLDRVPWPLEDERFDRIIISHVIEHVNDPVACMNEIHRVAQPGARVEITTPHFSNRCAYADPTHRRALSGRAFDFFTGSEPRPLHRWAVARNWLFEHRFEYEKLPSTASFSLVSRKLSFSRPFRNLGIAGLANRHLDFYEFYLAWLFPARDIHVVLQVEKG